MQKFLTTLAAAGLLSLAGVTAAAQALAGYESIIADSRIRSAWPSWSFRRIESMR